MQVEAIIEQADQLVGQEIDVEGNIIVIERAKRKIAFVASSQNIADEVQQQIFIDHSLAELKTIIRPLPTLQLMFRGVLTNPPYFYRFHANFRATLAMDADNIPILKDISQIEIAVPYVGKTSEWELHDSYNYSAQVDYTPVSVESQKRTARATVKSQKHLLLSKKESESESIATDENRYARRVVNQIVGLSGWLETAPSKNDVMSHMLFLTTSLRASMVAVGPLREETIIWLRPSGIYKLLKTHMPFSTETALRQSVEIIGQVDYLQDEDMPILHDKSPKLVFTQIDVIIIHEEHYLW